MSGPPFPNMDELLQRLLDGQIAPDDMKRLETAILEDRRVRDYYIDSLLVCAAIRRSSQVTGELSKSDLMQAISSGSKGSFKRCGRRIRSIAAILLIGMMVSASIFLVRHITRGPVIGTLTGAYEARWRGADLRPGKPLYARDYDLQDGVVKMELGRETSLLLEAPCQIKLTGFGEVALKSGRIVAEVSSEKAGFRVQTPTAVITDLGTEFGVVVYSDGSTEAHVLKGEISIALDPTRASQSTVLIVNEGQAASVDAAGRTVRRGLAARPDLFLLRVPPSTPPVARSKRLNLADIVGGGNGRGSGALDQGIDLGTGQAFRQPAATIRRARRNEFLATPEFPGVDGVFVPNGARGPVVISSTGLTFSECPDTLGSYYGGPANSGRIYDIPGKQIHTARLNGISLGTSRHPALNLHPNAGITFDLDQIRRDNPNVQIDRFTAICGIPKDLPQTPFSAADVWVLLDGVVCEQLNFPGGTGAVEKVDVSIPARTRFLTLAATCTGRADYSWVFMGNPFLEPAATVEQETER